jgi:hypothetical protein
MHTLQYNTTPLLNLLAHAASFISYMFSFAASHTVTLLGKKTGLSIDAALNNMLGNSS